MYIQKVEKKEWFIIFLVTDGDTNFKKLHPGSWPIEVIRSCNSQLWACHKVLFWDLSCLMYPWTIFSSVGRYCGLQLRTMSAKSLSKLSAIYATDDYKILSPVTKCFFKGICLDEVMYFQIATGPD